MSTPSIIDCVARCHATYECVGMRYSRELSLCQMGWRQQPGFPLILWNRVGFYQYYEALVKKELTLLGGEIGVVVVGGGGNKQSQARSMVNL